MTSRQGLYSRVAAIGVAGVLAAMAPQNVMAQAQSAIANVAIDNDDIGGVVTGPSGPEAGVWVIAETTELPTKFAKIVVTDDQGRYVIPDLPRGQLPGLGARLRARRFPEGACAPGQPLDLTAVTAPNDAAAAHYYPAIYWYSMMKIPPREPVRRRERHPRGRSPRTTGSSR